MIVRDNAMLNKGKQEMKLWVKIYHYTLKKGNTATYSAIVADEAIKEFNKTFNDYGNVE